VSLPAADEPLIGTTLFDGDFSLAIFRQLPLISPPGQVFKICPSFSGKAVTIEKATCVLWESFLNRFQ